MKALIIDDSRAMRRILTKIVTPLGFEVIEGENGRVGLDQLHGSDDIEIVMVDWNMPVMNGLEFVEAVRGDSKYQNQKIIMVTTETETEKMVRVLMAGVDEFVMKPFTAEILVEKMKLIGVKMPASSN